MSKKFRKRMGELKRAVRETMMEGIEKGRLSIEDFKLLSLINELVGYAIEKDREMVEIRKEIAYLERITGYNKNSEIRSL